MKSIQDIKEQLISEITLLDTSQYRCSGLLIDGKYKKEPKEFRFHLSKIYNSLSVEQLSELLKLKK